MIDGTFCTLSEPISSSSSRVSSSSRTPRSPTPALRMLTIGRMPIRAAVSREMTVCSDPVSSTKSICGPLLTLALTMIFSLITRNGMVCSLPADAGSMLQRRARAERAQEAHFRARPCGFRAAVLVRQQIDVARVRVGGFFVALHPLVDRADGVMELGIARILVERGLRRFSASSSLLRAARLRAIPCSARALSCCIASASSNFFSESSNSPTAHSASA